MGKVIYYDGEPIFSPRGPAGLDVYSTEETRIGTWVDGRPLYRVSGEGMTGTAIDSWYTIVKPIPYNVEVKFISIVIENTSGQYVPIAFESPANARIAYTYTNTDGVRFLNTDSIYNERPFAYEIKYTKTSDTATKFINSETLQKASDDTQYDLPSIDSVASSAKDIL